MQIVERVPSADGSTIKYLQKTSTFIVETSYIRQDRKHIICISTQVGCGIRCQFCASGLRADEAKYVRSLTPDEIVEQCLNVAREINFVNYPRPLLLSFMGEGEPFQNFGGFVSAAHLLDDMVWTTPLRLAVSTSGIKPDLIRLLGATSFVSPLKLQVSIHAPNDNLRQQMIPVSRPLQEIVEATRAFREISGRPVDLVYVLCHDFNDRREHAEELVRLLGPGWHVKFNRLNLTPGTPFRPGSAEALRMFVSLCEANGITTEYYETNEGDVQSGCGQLSYKYDELSLPRPP